MRRFITNGCLACLLALLSLPLGAQEESDSISQDSTQRFPRVERFSALRHKRWNALIPTQIVAQYAGDIGIASVGIGWHYGRRDQWESHLFWGMIPRYASDRVKVTMTFREHFLPWDVKLHRKILPKRYPAMQLSVVPLTVSYSLNTVFDHDFWTRQPERYPHGYYRFSTRMRSHLALGQRLNHTFISDNRLGLHSYAFYWEVSTTELDVIYKVQNHTVPLRDILHLAVGVKLQTL